MEQEFEYKLTQEGNAYITRYRPSAFVKETVTVPDTLDGHPVLRILPNAFRYAYISRLYLPDSLLMLAPDSFYRFSGNAYIPYNVEVHPGFTDGYGMTAHIGRGSNADIGIQQRKKQPYNPEIKCVYEEMPLIREKGLVYFLRKNGTLDLVDCESGDAEIVVPGQCQGYPVRRVSNGAFRKCKDLESVSFSEGLELIGCRAFEDLSQLKTVFLPESVHTIDGDGALLFGYHGSKQTVIVHADGNAYVENWCAKNRVLFQPAGKEMVKQDNLIFLLNPDGTAELAGCDRSYEIVRIPGNFRGHRVVAIQPYAFEGCAGMLKKVILEEGLRSIGKGAFSAVFSLGEAVLPESLREIGENAFWMCGNLMQIWIPAGVETIGCNAFGRCGVVVEVDREATEENHAHYAYGEMGYLKEVTKRTYNLTAIVTAGSYGEQYCRNNSIRYIVK